MSEQEDVMPGRNGGTLKRGNTKNVGRKPSVVRAKFLKGADFGTAMVLDIVRWKAVIPVAGAKGKDGNQLYRQPTFREWKEALECCLKYGLGTRQELTGTDDAPLKMLVSIDVEDI